MKHQLVKFLKQWGNYNKGEIAGFDPEKAEKLIEAKVAKAHKAPAKAKDTA